jgi:hypothetical protein
MKPLIYIKLRLSLTNSAILGANIEETVESGKGKKIKREEYFYEKFGCVEMS